MSFFIIFYLFISRLKRHKMNIFLVSLTLFGLSYAYNQDLTSSINYETISKNDFEFLNNNKLFILIACNYIIET